MPNCSPIICHIEKHQIYFYVEVFYPIFGRSKASSCGARNKCCNRGLVSDKKFIGRLKIKAKIPANGLGINLLNIFYSRNNRKLNQLYKKDTPSQTANMEINAIKKLAMKPPTHFCIHFYLLKIGKEKKPFYSLAIIGVKNSRDFFYFSLPFTIEAVIFHVRNKNVST